MAKNNIFFDALSVLGRAGLGAPIVVVMLLAMVVLPLPPFLLDIFFTFNISLSLIILLVTIYALRPLDFIDCGVQLLSCTSQFCTIHGLDHFALGASTSCHFLTSHLWFVFWTVLNNNTL